MAYTALQLARNVGSTLIGESGSAGEAVVDTDDYSLVIRNGSAPGGPAAPAKINADIMPPQGRLTLTSDVPVMVSDVGPGTAIYWTPYVGQYTPIYDGSYFRSVASGEISLGLSATNHTNGNRYDLVAFLNTGTLTLGTLPAWTNNSARSAAITSYNGLWVNNASATVVYGASGGSTTTVGAHQALVVGSFFATANGQTLMQFRKAPAAGGAAPILALYNFYNRVRYVTRSLDSTASWTYTTGTWRQSNNNGSNQASWFDGLAQSSVEAVFSCDAEGSVAIGVGLNSTSSPEAHTPTIITASGVRVNLTARDLLNPQLGFNTIQALEFGGSNGKFYGNGGQQLTLSLEM